MFYEKHTFSFVMVQRQSGFVQEKIEQEKIE